MARYIVPLEPAAVPAAPITPEPPAATGRYIVADPEAPSPFLHGLMQGGSLEWADEIAGLVGADKEAFRKRTKQAADISPSSYQAGKLAGTAATMLLPAGWAVRGGAGLAKMAKAGATIGGTTGAVEGLGEYEANPNASMADQITGGGLAAAKGGVVGAVTGGTLAPLLYTLGAGVRAGGRTLYDFATGGNNAALRKTEQALRRQDTDPKQLLDLLTADASPAVRGAKPEVLMDVLEGMQAQGATATSVAAAVNARHGTALKATDIGKLAKGFDRANPVPRDLIALSEELGGGEAGRSGLTNLMQAVATLPGRGREVALRNMGATMEAAPERMAQRLSGEMGDLNFRKTLASREMARKSAASKAYGQAYDDDLSATMAAAMKGKNAQTIEAELQPIWTGYALHGQQLGGETGSKVAQGVQIAAGIKPGSTAYGVNSLQRYHEARKTLDRFMADLRNSAAPDNNALRILGDMRRDMNQIAYARSKTFEAADKRFATDMAREEALRLGRKMPFRSSEGQDEVLAALRDLERRHSPQVAQELRDHFSQGMLRRMADEIETTGGVPGRFVQPLTGGIRPGPRKALEEALGAPLPGAAVAKTSRKATGAIKGQPAPYTEGLKQARDITAILGDEARLGKTFRDVWGNSKTAERMAAQEDLRALPGIAAEISTGGLGGLKNAVTKRLMQAITERNAEQIARIVTETDPRQLYLALQRIVRMQPKIKGGEALLGAPAISAGSAAGQMLTGQ